MRYSAAFLRRHFHEMTPRDLGPGFIRTAEHSEEAAARRLIGMHRSPAMMLLPEAQPTVSSNPFRFFSQTPSASPAERLENKSENKFRKD